MGAAEKPRTGRWDRSLTVAIIAFFAAIGGAAVGGVATYFGNQALQRERSKATARGIARVLQSDFTNAEPRLEVALQEKRIVLPDATSTVELDSEAEQPLASNLSAEAWEQIAATLLDLRLEIQQAANPTNEAAIRTKLGLRVPLTGAPLALSKNLLVNLRGSVRQLDTVAGDDLPLG
jgi:type VI protein secretion system component VasF